MAHRSQSCYFFSERLPSPMSPQTESDQDIFDPDSDNDLETFEVDSPIPMDSAGRKLNTPKRHRATDLTSQGSFLSGLFTLFTQGYNWMIIVYARDFPTASRPFKRFKFNNLQDIRIPPNAALSEAEEIDEEIERLELHSLCERRSHLQGILCRYEAKILHPLVRLMNRLSRSMKPAKSPIRPTSARLSGFTYSFENPSRHAVCTQVLFSQLGTEMPRDFRANPYSHPHKDPRYSHFNVFTLSSNITRLFAQDTSVKKFDVEKIDFSYAYKVLCKLFAIHQTGKVSDGVGIWDLTTILGGRWCQPFLFKAGQPEFVDGIPNEDLILKTVHYRPYCKNKNVCAEDMVRFLYLSYETYQFVESYKTDTGERLYQAKMYNKPHFDSYMVCERLYQPCHPVRWSCSENEKHELIFSRDSQRQLEHMRDYFYIALCLAKDEGILIDLSPMNVFYKDERYYLIDTLGIPINVTPLGFLYERILYWAVLDGKHDKRIFKMLISRYPKDLQRIFLEAFPKKNRF